MTVHLTAAQWKVASCIGRGLSYAQTAKELGVVRQTVRIHVFNIARFIPNPHGLPQKQAVLRWLEDLHRPRPMAETSSVSNTYASPYPRPRGG